MLRSMFIYVRSSGLSIWEKNFEPQGSIENLQMYSSFFSAIQNYIHEILKNTKEFLHQLDLGQITLYASDYEIYDLEMVTISDRGDNKIIAALEKFHQSVGKILDNNKDLLQFSDWMGNVEKFSFLTYPIICILRDIREQDNIELIPLTIEQNILLQGPQLLAVRDHVYENEFHKLESRLKRAQNYVEKSRIVENLESVARNLNDPLTLQGIQQEKRRISYEITNVQTRASYFLKQTKEALNKLLVLARYRSYDELDFRDVYLGLYSFAGKLAILGSPEKADLLKNMAMQLIEENLEIKRERATIVQKILLLPDEIESYLPPSKSN